MSNKRGDHPAQPQQRDWVTMGPHAHQGMTIREAFAKDAPPMPPEWHAAYMELHGQVPRFSAVETMEAIRAASAEWARSHADALLAALEEEQKP